MNGVIVVATTGKRSEIKFIMSLINSLYFIRSPMDGCYVSSAQPFRRSGVCMFFLYKPEVIGWMFP